MQKFLKCLLIVTLVQISTNFVYAGNIPLVPIPGTKISCVPLNDFVLSKAFVGLESTKYQTSIVFMELPWPPKVKGEQFIPFIKSHFSPEALASKGVKLQNTELINAGTNSGIIFKTNQLANSIKYIKWIVFIEERNETIFQIQVASPSIHFSSIESDILRLIKSIQINNEQYKVELPYSINLPEGWGLAKQHGIMELYTETGSFPKKNKNESYLAVLNLQEHVNSADKEVWIKQKNTQRNYFSNFKVLSSENIIIHGIEANISVVSCHSTRDSKNVTKLYCYIFLDKTTFLLESEIDSKMNKTSFAKICSSWRLNG